MESDSHRRLPGDHDPLDKALEDLPDLADLERSFAELDLTIRSQQSDDPFTDIADVLREYHALQASDNDSLLIDHDLDADSDIDLDMLEEYESATQEELEQARAIEQLCQEALDALESDELTLAKETALNAVRIDDEHPFPMFVLGLVAERQGDLDTARDMADLALRSAETNPDAIGLRAHIHVAQHEFKQASELLRFGITHNPDEAMLHEGLARVSLAIGDYERALQSASMTLRIEPTNAGAIAVRAAALDHVADRSSVLAALRQSVLIRPEDPYPMLELASLEMEDGNLDRARALLTSATRLAPHNHEIKELRILIDHVDRNPLLKPVPSLLKWLRDFPGGKIGFLLGLVIVALPLNTLAVVMPQYKFAALGILYAWGAVAMYALVAPLLLIQGLNKRAAKSAYEKLEKDLQDPLSSLPTASQYVDVVSLLIDANNRKQALALTNALLLRTSSKKVSRQSLDYLAKSLNSLRTKLALGPLSSPMAMLISFVLLSAYLIVIPSLAPDYALAISRTAQISLLAVAGALALLISRTQRHIKARLEQTLNEFQALTNFDVSDHK